MSIKVDFLKILIRSIPSTTKKQQKAIETFLRYFVRDLGMDHSASRTWYGPRFGGYKYYEISLDPSILATKIECAEKFNKKDLVVLYVDVDDPVKIHCCAADKFRSIYKEYASSWLYRDDGFVEVVGYDSIKFKPRPVLHLPATRKNNIVVENTTITTTFVTPCFPLYYGQYGDLNNALNTGEDPFYHDIPYMGRYDDVVGLDYEIAGSGDDFEEITIFSCLSRHLSRAFSYMFDYMIFQLYKTWHYVAPNNPFSDEERAELEKCWQAFPSIADFFSRGGRDIPIMVKEVWRQPIAPYYVRVRENNEFVDKWMFFPSFLAAACEMAENDSKTKSKYIGMRLFENNLEDLYLYDLYRNGFSGFPDPGGVFVKGYYYESLGWGLWRFFMEDDGRMGTVEDAIKRNVIGRKYQHALRGKESGEFVGDDWCFARRAWNVPKSVFGYRTKNDVDLVEELGVGDFYDDALTDGFYNIDPAKLKKDQKVLRVGLDEVEQWVDEAQEEFAQLEEECKGKDEAGEDRPASSYWPKI